ncbi:MBOAT family O-acyltransferase [Tropicimonas sp.]|uniref:MBOAT family O-acyltransferase n=1 Tax=Tropicimonas sp. TaxID=2067044 RepID=UPI003A852114
MLFHTSGFAVFFVAVLTTYALLSRHAPRWRIGFLIAASFVFYGAWDWRFTGLLAGSAVFNHFVALKLQNTTRPEVKKALLTFAVAANLTVLGTFKYFDFFLTSLNELLYRLGTDELPYFMEFILPVGISFFTFQALSYVVDVYRGDLRASTRLSETLLFISFFPQLVAGPIVRASAMLPQIRSLADSAVPPRRIALGFAGVMILSGLFKKLFVANYLATDLVDEVFFDPASYNALDLLFAAYGYTIQIYCDFSGYSDMAIGLSALLGFAIPINFDRPFRATSMREFWHRWHISLSTWLRDYLYIPLGGNRLGPARARWNLMITMLLGGLWHGAAWTFVLWGALHGAFLVVESWLRERTRVRLPAWLGFLVTFHLVVLTFVIFRIESISLLWDYLAGFRRTGGTAEVLTPFTAGLVAYGVFVHLLPSLTHWMARAVDALPWPVAALGAAVAVTLIAGLAPAGVTPFIYFQF